MPFKSKAQRAKFAEMVKDGKMTQAEFDKWNADTPTGHLPERLSPKKHTSLKDIKQTRKDKYGC